ncbi:MAG: YbgC/FadM family acyl-CoA thioesterase [Burkholderiaceae bacterium]
MQRSEFRSLHRLRVRWAEVDMQKIVFNAHYLMYFDTAVTDYWRAVALPYEAAMHLLEGDVYVAKATVEFHASARMDDMLDVGMKCSRIGNSSMTFTGAIFRGEEHLISGELVYVFADPATQRSRPVPQALRDILLGYEAGEPVFSVRVGSWDELGAQAGQIRNEVFVQEQGIAREIEVDAFDATAVHALAVNRLGQPLATGRLLRPEPGVGQVGRMAVSRVMRGSSIGAAVLRSLLDVARARGDREVCLHAQRSAVGFYLRMGFAPRGAAFHEAGIEHQEMVFRF